MKTKIVSFVIFIFIVFCFERTFAQTDSPKYIMGTIADKVTLMPLVGESTICLMMSDSTTVVTEGKVFKNKNKRGKDCTSFYVFANEPGNYLIRVSNPFYYPLYYPIEVRFYKRELYIEDVRLLMRRKLLTDNIDLDEVTITATKLKFYFDKDTLIYNAEQFVTQEGFVLNDILKKMPGIEIKEDGTVFSNGKKVDYLLLNGRDFFNKDRQTILENLPAFMLKSVKVYEKTLNPDALLEREKSIKGLTMDIKLKKDYETTSLANIDVGLGTDTRYYGKLFGLTFTPCSRLSAYATSNNTNHDDLFGQDGEARNQGKDNGEKETSKAGFNYNMDNPQGTYELEGDAQFQYVDSKTLLSTKTQMFLREGDNFNQSFISNFEKPLSFKTKHRIALYNNKPYSFTVSPYITYDKKKNSVVSIIGSFKSDVEDLIGPSWIDTIASRQQSIVMSMYGIYRALSNQFSSLISSNAAVDLNKTISIPHCSDVLALNAKLSFQKNESDIFSQTNLEYMNPQKTTWDNQYQKLLSSGKDFGYGAVYTYVISPLSNFVFNLSSQFHNEGNQTPIYSLDKLIEYGYDTSIPIGIIPEKDNLALSFDEHNSFQYKMKNAKQAGSITYNTTMTKKKKNISHTRKWSISIPARLERNELTYSQYRTDTISRQSKLIPEFNLSYQHNRDKGEKIISNGLSYTYSEQLPPLLKTVDVLNDAHPLMSRYGNPHLKSEQTHNLQVSFYSMPSFNSYHSYAASYSLKNRSIVDAIIYDKNTGYIKTMPKNSGWTDQLLLTLLDNFNVGKDHTSKINNRFIYFYNNMESYFDTMGNDFKTSRTLRSYIIDENLSFEKKSSDNKNSVGIAAFARYTVTADKSKELSTVDILDIGSTLSGYVELPFNLRMSSELTGLYRMGYSNVSMNDWECILNVSLTKAFKNNITLQLEGFDLLKQRKSLFQTVSTVSRIEQETNNLGRYVMLHFIWRVNSKPKSERGQAHNHIHEQSH